MLRWFGIRLRRDWRWDRHSARPRLILEDVPRPGWYMLSMRVRGEPLRCYGLFGGSQGRVLLRDRLRRRLVRIHAGSKELVFELRGINGDVRVPVLRLVPQPPGRVRQRLRRKLVRLHPAYHGSSQPRSLPGLWSDYNRLLARGHTPLVGYDQWIERIELPVMERERAGADAADNAGTTATGRLRFVPGLWGDRPTPADLARTRSSLESQLSGDYVLLDQEQDADSGDPTAWRVLLQWGDRLAPQALRRFADALSHHPDAQILYADEDRISPTGRRHSPQFKPAWNPELLYSDPHYSHCWLIRSDLAMRVASTLAEAGEEVGLYGLVLEATAAVSPQQIVHLPEVLYHRADRSGEARGDKSSAATLERFLARRGHPIQITPRAGGGHCLHWPLPDPPPLVSVVIPTRDRADLLRCCLDSLERTAAGNPPTELLVIDNDSSEAASLAFLAELQSRPGVTVLRRPGPFNFAAFNNEAAALARGELLAFLNNDVEALRPGWLRPMVAEAIRPGIGAVGARLLFDDGSVQHAGVLLGIGGVAGHAHKYLDGEAEGYQLRLRLTHQVSAVTAAAMVVRRSLFLEVGGFDASHFAVNYNDVDLCLRLMAGGYRNLYCPDAVLVHHESRSRGAPSSPAAFAQWQKEREAMQRRWGPLLQADPHYSPHLSLVEENFSLALAKQRVRTRAGGEPLA